MGSSRAAACTGLAEEYAAAFAAGQGLASGSVLDEVPRLTRQRGAAVSPTFQANSLRASGLRAMWPFRIVSPRFRRASSVSVTTTS